MEITVQDLQALEHVERRIRAKLAGNEDVDLEALGWMVERVIESAKASQEGD
jgi:hypothetical protein